MDKKSGNQSIAAASFWPPHRRPWRASRPSGRQARRALRAAGWRICRHAKRFPECGAARLKAEDYAEALLERCNAQKSLNAFITLNPDQVMRDARAADRLRASGAHLGPLHGLPIPVKDCVNTKDYDVTTAGTPRRCGIFIPPTMCPSWRCCAVPARSCWARPICTRSVDGWTSTMMLSARFTILTIRAAFPAAAAAAPPLRLADQMAPRHCRRRPKGPYGFPAALCGLVGFRPTTGRYSSEGTPSISPLFDQVRAARSIEDVVLFDSVVAKPAEAPKAQSAKDLRIAVCRSYYFDGLDSRVAKHADEALKRLRAAGVTLVETELPGLSAT